MSNRFENRGVAVVTGAARGIGLAIATRLAAEGLDLALIDRHEEALAEAVSGLQSRGARAVGVAADLTQSEGVARAFREISETSGRIGFLVNNAGAEKNQRFLSVTESDWDFIVNTNLKSQFLCCQAVLPAMVEERFGRIVNISSRAWLGGPGQAHYSASKGGVVSLTRTLALEFASKGVTVNAIAPGIVDTPMFRGFQPELQEKLAQTVPVRRVGTPEDIARAVTFFLDPEASYVTGQTLYVCGGRSLSSASV